MGRLCFWQESGQHQVAELRPSLLLGSGARSCCYQDVTTELATSPPGTVPERQHLVEFAIISGPSAAADEGPGTRPRVTGAGFP